MDLGFRVLGLGFRVLGLGFRVYCAVVSLQHWLSLEREGGDSQSIQRVFRLLPKKIKKRKTIKNANGVEEVTETLTFVFPDDESSAAVRHTACLLLL